jgi:hypothetical protein
MRRAVPSRVVTIAIALVLASAITMTWAAAPPAQAHFCSNPVQFEVHKPGAVAFGVPAEDFAVTEVDVSLPAAFQLQGLDGPPEWKSTQQGRQLHLLGGPIEPFTCAFFTLRGVVDKAGKITIPFVIRGEGGRSSEYKGTKINDPFSGQLVFAGVSPKQSDYLDVSSGDSGGGSTFQPAFLAAAGGLTVGGALALLARRRASGG